MVNETTKQLTPTGTPAAPDPGHLQSGRIQDAIQVFSDLLADAPNDPQLNLTLGDLYHRAGDDQRALNLYTQARRLDPADPLIETHLAALKLPAHLDAATAVPNEIEVVEGLLQEMTRRETPISEAEIERAAELLKQILNSTQPAQVVAEHLDEIDALLPALIELNIRQAQADGQPELAEGLASLLHNIQLQIEQRRLLEGQAAAELTAGRVRGSVKSHSSPTVMILNPDVGEANARMTLAAEALGTLGCRMQIAEDGGINLSEKPDVVLVSDPHTSPWLLQQMAVYAAANIPIIVDIDQDFEQMPANHPDYDRYGLGNLENSRAYLASLMLAQCITVPCPALSNAVSQARCPVRVVPDGWSESVGMWKKTVAHRSTLNLGWVGFPGHVEDVTPVRRLIVRIMREFRQTQLVIAGEASVFQLFDTLPDARILYLPAASAEDHPYLLSQMDLVLNPLRNIPFNRTQSDRILVEAGVRQIPWLASPIPAFREWGEGGIIADSHEEWYDGLHKLVTQEELRQSLGQQGYRKALQREKQCLGPAWLGAIQACLGSGPVRPAQPFIDE